MSDEVLLGNLNFVTRTTGSVDEREFKNTPYILDSEARLHIGPADDLARDEHGAILVVYEYLRQTKKMPFRLSTLLSNRSNFLQTCVAFDAARRGSDETGPTIIIYGTYDGKPIESIISDDLPAGPCGKSVNQMGTVSPLYAYGSNVRQQGFDPGAASAGITFHAGSRWRSLLADQTTRKFFQPCP